MLSKGSTKTRMVSEPVSIAGLSESGGNAKSQENPASTLLLSSGNAGSCCKGWYPCFRLVVKLFTNLQNPFPFPRAPGNSGEKSGACIQGFLIPFCQSCIPAGMIAIYMTEGNRILPWSFRISFSIHLYCISPSFLQPPSKDLL